MKFNKIKAFGCSNTFGHGLSDCHVDPDFPGPIASKFAWPSILSQKLGDVPFENWGQVGASPKEVSYIMANVEINADDLVLILWPQHHRTCFLKDNLVPPPSHRESFGANEVDIHRIGPWMPPEHTYYENYYHDMDAVYMFTLITNLVKYKLDDIGATHLHRTYYDVPNIPSWNAIDFGDTDFHEITKLYPLGLDGHHPGPEAHIKFADNFFNSIIN